MSESGLDREWTIIRVVLVHEMSKSGRFTSWTRGGVLITDLLSAGNMVAPAGRLEEPQKGDNHKEGYCVNKKNAKNAIAYIELQKTSYIHEDYIHRPFQITQS